METFTETLASTLYHMGVHPDALTPNLLLSVIDASVTNYITADSLTKKAILTNAVCKLIKRGELDHDYATPFHYIVFEHGGLCVNDYLWNEMIDLGEISDDLTYLDIVPSSYGQLLYQEF